MILNYDVIIYIANDEAKTFLMPQVAETGKRKL